MVNKRGGLWPPRLFTWNTSVFYRILFCMNMYIFAGLTFFIVTIGFILYRVFFIHPPTPQADLYFSQSSAEVYKIAKSIEQHRPLSAKLLENIVPVINNRFGADRTLLLHATYFNNFEAATALLKIGADPFITQKSDGSGYNFFRLVTDPSRRSQYLRPNGVPRHLLSAADQPLYDAEDQDIVTNFVQGYIDAGGDPSVQYEAGIRNGNPYQVTWASELALMKYTEAATLLVKAGLDPWAGSTYVLSTDESSERLDLEGSLMGMLASETYAPGHIQLLHDYIDQGYFDNRTQAELVAFFDVFGSYAQRGDQRSQDIKTITMRILKRNPQYDTTIESDDSGTKRIFKNHWEDKNPGTIPWDIIMSDQIS